MNDALFCSLYLDIRASKREAVALAATITSGSIRNGGVDLPWARICAGDSGGNFAIRQRDPDDFLGWDVFLEVMPADDVARDTVVAEVSELMMRLKERGIRIVAVADYSDDLPGRGELMG